MAFTGEQRMPNVMIAKGKGRTCGLNVTALIHMMMDSADGNATLCIHVVDVLTGTRTTVAFPSSSFQAFRIHLEASLNGGLTKFQDFHSMANPSSCGSTGHGSNTRTFGG